jgi:hypothetical protein
MSKRRERKPAGVLLFQAAGLSPHGGIRKPVYGATDVPAVMNRQDRPGRQLPGNGFSGAAAHREQGGGCRT